MTREYVPANKSRAAEGLTPAQPRDVQKISAAGEHNER